jgi:hypothetical protein
MNKLRPSCDVIHILEHYEQNSEIIETEEDGSNDIFSILMD